MGRKNTKLTNLAIGYVRVSTVGQADHGVSLEAQESKIRDWCAANNFVLGSVMVDRGISGSRADTRPALQEALASVRRGSVIVVYSLSRLARSTRDTLEIADALERRGADLVSLSEKIDTTSAAGRMVFRLLAVLAEFERDVISERTSMAMRHLRSQGRYIGGGAPLGSRLQEDGTLVPVIQEQETINLAKSLHAAGGMTLRRIAAKLGAEGHLSRGGKVYMPEQIRRMLKAG
jgi:site-specific DNA recombinase